MGIEPTRDLIDPTLVLKTRGTTRHQSPPQRIFSYFIKFHNNISASSSQWILAPSEIGFDWLCFFAVSNCLNLYNPLLLLILRHFTPPANWLCFFKSLFAIRITQYSIRNKLALFGFVFRGHKTPKITEISINPYCYWLSGILPILTLALFFQIALIATEAQRPQRNNQ